MSELQPSAHAPFTAVTSLYEGAQSHKRQVDESVGGRDIFEMESQRRAPKYFCLACSDARVDPYRIFNLVPGQMLQHRNMGNVATVYTDVRRGRASAGSDDSFADALRCALNMQVDYILILGHTRCETTHRVMDQVAYSQGTGDDVASNRWLHGLEAVRHRVGALYSNLPADERYRAAACENARLQRERILAHAGVQNALATGALLGVEAFVYEVEQEHAGLVSHWQDAQQRFVPVNATHSGLPVPARAL